MKYAVHFLFTVFFIIFNFDESLIDYQLILNK